MKRNKNGNGSQPTEKKQESFEFMLRFQKTKKIKFNEKWGYLEFQNTFTTKYELQMGKSTDYSGEFWETSP